jgi:hypothetical protein
MNMKILSLWIYLMEFYNIHKINNFNRLPKIYMMSIVLVILKRKMNKILIIIIVLVSIRKNMKILKNLTVLI